MHQRTTFPAVTVTLTSHVGSGVYTNDGAVPGYTIHSVVFYDVAPHITRCAVSVRNRCTVVG